MSIFIFMDAKRYNNIKLGVGISKAVSYDATVMAVRARFANKHIDLNVKALTVGYEAGIKLIEDGEK